MKKRGACLVLLLLIILSSLAGSAEDKIGDNVIQSIEEYGSADVIVKLKEAPVKRFGLFKVKDPRESLDEDELDKKYDYSIVKGFSGKINEEGLRKLEGNPNVEKVYLDEDYYINLQDSVPLVNATVAKALQVEGINVTGYGQAICILDSGVNYTHPDLGSCASSSFLSKTCTKVIDGYDYVNNDNNPMDGQGHGTHVAGIAAANGTIKGVAPGASIIAIKVCDDSSDGVCSDSNIYSGMEWCINNASIYNITVISMSFGSLIPYSSYCDDIYPTMAAYVNSAVAKNITVVVSTGNDYSTTSISSPACIKNSTAVGSTTKADAISDFSNRNSLTDMLAPGSSINSTYKDGDYEVLSGTSMSAPHVSGAVALLQNYKRMESNIVLTPYQVQDALNKTGFSIIDTEGSKLTFQRIDILKALWAVDTKAPSLFGVSISHNSVYNYSDVTFFANSTDTSLRQVWLELNMSGNRSYYSTQMMDTDMYNVTIDNGNFTPNLFVEWRVAANDSNNNINYTSWANFTVQSGAPVIVMNYPANNSYLNIQEVAFNFTATDDKALLLNCTLNIDGVSNATNATTNNGTSTTFRVNLTELSHNWSVYCLDNQSNNASSSLFKLDIDITSPLFSSLSINFSVIELGNTQLITVNITDSYLDYANISYSGINRTMGREGTFLNYSFITTLNGTLRFILYAFDLANNQNLTSSSFIVNDSAPEPRLITPRLNATVPKNDLQEISVWALDSDAISAVLLDFNGTNFTMANSSYYNYSYSWNVTGCGVSNYSIFANDSYNNIVLGRFNFTTSFCCGNNACESGESCSSCSSDCGNCPTVSSGGGGGGSSGGASGPLNAITHVFPQITPDKPVLGKITREEFEVTGIELQVYNEVSNAKVKVERLQNKPDDVSPLGRAYKYLKIETTNLNSDNLKEAAIDFKVNRSWIVENSFNKSMVRLYRFTGSWEELPTRIVNQTIDHIFYKAETKGFSYFAIAVKKEPEKFVLHEEEKEGQNATLTGSIIKEGLEEPKKETFAKKLKVPFDLIISLSFVVFVLVLCYIYERYPNKNIKRKRK